MYDRRAIMTAAHRDYESRAETVAALAIKGRRSVTEALRALWKTCLRGAWRAATDAVQFAQPVTKIEQVRQALAFEEAADRGYNAGRAAALRAELATITLQAA